MKFSNLDTVRLLVDVQQPDARDCMLFMPAGAVGMVVEAYGDDCDVEFLTYAQKDLGGPPIDSCGVLELPVSVLEMVIPWHEHA